jgi:AmmeMemoRadiSam system protein B/AmmeMemoRadiSam system protein A
MFKGKVMIFKVNIKVVMMLAVWMAVFNGFTQNSVDRKPYAAGIFYPSDSAELKKELDVLFKKAERKKVHNVLALISPHAGIQYSGEVAATAYKQLDPGTKFENIFIIGSSHTMYLNGASIYVAGNYLTPLGKVAVNIDLSKKLIKQNRYISFVPEAHIKEHIIENQLPFIQYYFKNPVRIVPIVIGTDDPKKLKSIAQTLEPYLNEKNLFVISSDFSHYPNYEDARKADSTTAKGILSNDPNKFLKALETNKKRHYPGLVTSACSWTSILSLMYISSEIQGVKYIPLKYMNSGDVDFGDKNRVVGYFALALDKQTEEVVDFLSDEDKRTLLKIARNTIETYLRTGQLPKVDTASFSPALKVHTGAFVTLNKENRLRGCIGRFMADEPLWKVVQQMAVAAAVQGPRFPPVKPVEMDKTNIEISVLTPLKKINSIDEIKLGRDGIYLVKNNRSGTFLPQVATETGWNLEEFLGHCARDKAGLGWNGWKDAELYTYQAIVFDEKEFQ